MLIRNSLFNLIGFGAPLLAAIFSIPPLITILGLEKFGILTLLWAFVSYFGIFDLGLGKALTQRLSELRYEDQGKCVGGVVGTALTILFCVGSVTCVAAIVVANYSNYIYNLQAGVVKDATVGLAFALPAITITSGLKGILESYGKFNVLLPIRIVMGVYTFVVPLAIALFIEPNLEYIAWSLTAGRYLGLYWHWVCVKDEISGERINFVPSEAFKLINSGGWLTVSNIVNPLMGYIDRFILAAVLSAAAVSFYATPQEIVMKLWIVPGALTTALFPVLVENRAKKNDASWGYFLSATKLLYWVMLPVTLFISYYSDKILDVWINVEFSRESGVILQLFSLGIFINCLAHMPLVWTQTEKKYKIVAMLSIVQMPFYIGAFYVFAECYGLLGATITWLGRIVIDSTALFYLSINKKTVNIKQIAYYCGCALLLFSISFLDCSDLFKLFVLVAVCTVATVQTMRLVNRSFSNF